MNKYHAKQVNLSELVAKANLVVTYVQTYIKQIEGPSQFEVAGLVKILEERFSKLLSLKAKDKVDAAFNAAQGVALYGETIALQLKNPTAPTDAEKTLGTMLSDASKDLLQYCDAYNFSGQLAGAINIGLEGVVQDEPYSDQRIAQLKAEVEAITRSILGMETRLEAMGRTADAAIERVEELTLQQAEAMRAALSREVSGITDGFAATNKALKDRLSEFDGFREQAKSLLGQMAAEVLAGGHIKSAQEEESAANSYRKWALSVMILGVFVIGVMQIFFTLDQGLTWAGLANRAMVAFLFVVPTAYLARESAKHRAQAIDLRRASLDFAALEPFLKGIEGEEGLKVRAELARRAFFTGNAVDSSSSYGLDPQALILKAMDIAADAVKKK